MKEKERKNSMKRDIVYEGRGECAEKGRKRKGLVDLV